MIQIPIREYIIIFLNLPNRQPGFNPLDELGEEQKQTKYITEDLHKY